MTQPSPGADLQYFMVTWGIGDEFGGMTTMCLYRAGIFRRLAGITAPVLTFNALATYDETRARLRRTGLLDPETPVLNLYEYYRGQDLLDMEPLAVPRTLDVPLPGDVVAKESFDSSGRMFSSVFTDPAGEQTYCRKFFRTDGSLFALDDTPPEAAGKPKERLISLFNSNGEVVKQYSTASRWYRDWLDILVAQKPSAFIVDSGYASRFMAKFESPYAVKAVVYHNNHVAAAGDPYRGRLAKGRQHIAENPHEWDGIVFLTEQQRQEFINRFGHTSNLFTISNPRARMQEAPSASIRQQNRGVMLCRLVAAKNIPAAVDVIDLVREAVPDIQLDIYGDGAQRDDLQDLVDRRGLGQNIVLRGYVSNAADELETSTFSLLTSIYEGQPLSVMESLGRGCPPVAFDIPYGPQDLIQDGHNGFLVAAGDIDTAAQHVVDLCLNPDLAASMSHNAWETSERFGDQAVLDMWKSTIDVMWEQQGALITDIEFDLERIDLEREAGLSIRGRLSWTDPAPSGSTTLPVIELLAMPRTSGKPKRKTMEVKYHGNSVLGVRAVFDQMDLDEIVMESDQEVDFSVVVTCGKVRKIVRLPFGSPVDPLRLYPTSQVNVSLKTVQ